MRILTRMNSGLIKGRSKGHTGMNESQLKAFFGIDLSIRNTGICFIPPEWDKKPDSLICKNVIIDEKDVTGIGYERRLLGISEQINSFIKDCIGCRNIDIHVALEEYAYSRRSRSSSSLAEIGGVVRSMIWRDFKVSTHLVGSGTARKNLMGKTRRKRRDDAAKGIKPLPIKSQVKKFLKNRSFFVKGWNNDVIDAFVVAYWKYCQVFRGSNFFEPSFESELIMRRKK